MATIPAKCPKCGSPIDLGAAGSEELVCPQCGHAFRLDAEGQAVEAPDPLGNGMRAHMSGSRQGGGHHR